MRRRIGLIATLVAIAAFAMPGSAAARSRYFSYQILDNYCDGEVPVITVRMIKKPGIYLSDFTMDVRAQYRYVGFFRWRNEGQNSHFYQEVTYDLGGYQWDNTLTYDVVHVNEWHRLKIKLRWWDGNYLLAVANVKSVYC